MLMRMMQEDSAWPWSFSQASSRNHRFKLCVLILVENHFPTALVAGLTGRRLWTAPCIRMRAEAFNAHSEVNEQQLKANDHRNHTLACLGIQRAFLAAGSACIASRQDEVTKAKVSNGYDCILLKDRMVGFGFRFLFQHDHK